MHFSGIGSWPGADVDEAQRIVRDLTLEGDGIPHLVELPERGPGADMIGRAAAMLVDLPVSYDHGAWQLSDVADTHAHLGRAFLRQDIDVAAEVFAGYEGVFKIQVTGPWTLASILRLPTGNPVLADEGAFAELTASLIEGMGGHIADMCRQIPGATALVQVDEPMMGYVVDGAVKHRSGLWAFPAIPADRAIATVQQFAPDIIHCCATPTPLTLVEWAPRVAADVRDWGESTWERARETVAQLWAGGASAELLYRQWPGEVVVTPPCGLAGSSNPTAALRRCRDVVLELEDRRA